jgi:hypothetical protein
VQKFLGATGTVSVAHAGPTIKVFRRSYANGSVYFAVNHGGIPPTCAGTFNITLSNSFIVHPDGTYGPEVLTSYTIRAGEGRVFLAVGKVPDVELE